MLVENQFIEIKWTKGNKEYYENKGYKFTNINDILRVKAEDLKPWAKNIVQVKCDYCGEKYNAIYRNYCNGLKNIKKSSCKKCVGFKCSEITLKKRQEHLYSNLIKASKKTKYKILSKKEDIMNNTTYISYLCPEHGIQKMRLSNFVSGKKCPKCAIKQNQEKYKFDTNTVIQIIERYNTKILNPQEYINNSTKNLKILCPNCNTPFITSLKNFTQHGGQLCPECNKKSISKGELLIKKYLENNKIPFKQQYWFPDCRDINPLPFDFYLYDNNIIIEFDGRQHYGETYYFSYGYTKTKEHDNIKNKYCRDNNIKLIRIPYWNMNIIDKILDNNLHKDIV